MSPKEKENNEEEEDEDEREDEEGESDKGEEEIGNDDKENNEKLINSMKENIYAIIEDHGNNIFIFNYYTNKLEKYKISPNDNNMNFTFNSHYYSLFDKNNNCIYVSGGLKDINDKNSYDDSFHKININFIIYNKNDIDNDINNDINNYEEEKNNMKKSGCECTVETLSSMENARSDHSMLQLSSNQNILICVGEINTESCEVYNIEFDTWIKIQDLPIKCQNPGIIENNNKIYIFPYSQDFTTIYELNMNNKDYILENIKYNINEGKVRKGVAVIPIEKTIYLLGGYENKDLYSDIYKVDLSHDDCININKAMNLNLPKKCFFSSNYLLVNINDNEIINNEKNNGNNKDFNLKDIFNDILKYNCTLDKFNYFES
jgi:hypothetical protein